MRRLTPVEVLNMDGSSNHASLMATVGETKEVIRLSHSTVHKLIREGVLRSVKVGTRRLVYFDSIRALLKM
jgi:excisionase family DNA binding protein